VPAATVIPAPIAYISVVAKKKLVVGSRDGESGPPFLVCTDLSVLSVRDALLALTGWDAESTMLL
jgi:hypothetical protein